ncbi:uncharacterized protein NPIL_622201 [Nephila pilipes]|uniref:Uncharacterized protein n=1 Tax=Nephila pilipes TaxID=299642 RepID=A0A8X6QC01_NEPPI|nr:uncharacterized protein NPIL_622201 [Nephila pilipes]
MLLIPALEDLAAVPVAINLYNDRERQQFLKDTQLRLSPSKEWKAMMKKMMPNHIYSRQLQQKIMIWLKRIHYEVEMWKEHHETFVGRKWNPRIITTFQWEPDGTIDRFKTASALIQCDILQLRYRFRLACNYWHDKRVLPIWEQMTSRLKNSFYKIQTCYIRKSERPFNINVIHWIRKFTGVGEGNIREQGWFRSYNCRVQFLQDSLAQNSTAEERLETIELAVCWNYETYHRSGRFCVLPTTTDQRLEVQDDLTRYYLPRILHIILCERIIPRWEDFDFVELMQELWSLIPNESKEFVKRYDVYKPIALIVANGHSVLPELKRYSYHNHLMSMYENSFGEY